MTNLTTVTFSSVTSAMKAEQVFRNNGYRCEIKRIPRTLGGCGYKIDVSAGMEMTNRILELNFIRYGSIGGEYDEYY